VARPPQLSIFSGPGRPMCTRIPNLLFRPRQAPTRVHVTPRVSVAGFPLPSGGGASVPPAAPDNPGEAGPVRVVVRFGRSDRRRLSLSDQPSRRGVAETLSAAISPKVSCWGNAWSWSRSRLSLASGGAGAGSREVSSGGGAHAVGVEWNGRCGGWSWWLVQGTADSEALS
jgi:hypothetical protein